MIKKIGGSFYYSFALACFQFSLGLFIVYSLGGSLIFLCFLRRVSDLVSCERNILDFVTPGVKSNLLI